MISDKPWKPEAVMRLALGLFASISAGALVAQVLFLFGDRESDLNRQLTFTVGTVSFHGAGMLLIHLFLREHGIRWKDLMDWRGFAARRIWAYAILGLMIALPLVWLVNRFSGMILEWFRVAPQLQASVEALQKTQSILQIIYFGLIALCVAPLVEEVLFRGILYPVLKAQGHPFLALTSTSLLFAATHANLMAFLPLTVLAMMLVVLYEMTDNLAAPILVHSLFNLTNFTYVIWEGLRTG
jgi:membrane protease YdiL (CAAX protease family)